MDKQRSEEKMATHENLMRMILVCNQIRTHPGCDLSWQTEVMKREYGTKVCDFDL